jgi:hypothetical protein
LPFGQGSDLFEALTLISLSDHSLAKATQAIGEEAQQQEVAKNPLHPANPCSGMTANRNRADVQAHNSGAM